MNVQEMETARRYDLNIVVMVWEDNAYGVDRMETEQPVRPSYGLEFRQSRLDKALRIIRLERPSG